MSREGTDDMVRRARDGDPVAAAELYEKHAADVLRFIRARLSQRLRARVESGDVAQDACVAAIKSLPKFTYQGPGSFLRWMRTIAENQIRMLNRYHFQTQKRAADRERPMRPAETDQPEGWSTPEANDARASQEALGRERANLVQRLLSALPEDHGAVIQLTTLDGLTLAESAERMGRSPDATRKLLVRALQRCATLMTESQFSGLRDYAEE